MNRQEIWIVRIVMKLWNLLKMFNKTYNQTLIVITHDERIALQADRVISIEDGRIAKDEVIRP